MREGGGRDFAMMTKSPFTGNMGSRSSPQLKMAIKGTFLNERDR